MYKFLTIAVVFTVSTGESRHVKKAEYKSEKIIGGKATLIELAPYQVSIEQFGKHHCGGSIISNAWVVTAGHCVHDGHASYFNIRAGTSRRSRGGSFHTVDKVIVHERFSLDKAGHPVNDIALLRVLEPFVFDGKCQPIDLFDDGENILPGSFAVITGWGTTGRSSPDVLQLIEVPIISKQQCQRNYAKRKGIPVKQICAAYAEGGKDACQGDSGGPLVIDGRLAGIVSWGHGCAVPGSPGVYTEIASYRAWIKTKTGV